MTTRAGSDTETEDDMTEQRECEDCEAPFEIGPELYPGGPLIGQNQTRCGPCTDKAAAPIFGRL
jgi:hypothetical protein